MNEYVEIEDIEIIKKLLVSLLKDLNNICEENGITYNIFGGTMLGAVRHGGMIPWDDDVDVTMPDYDYEKFIKLVKEKYSDKFQILDISDKNYIYPFAKFSLKDSLLIEHIVRKPYNLSKLYVDIFPVYGYPENADKVFKEVNKNRHRKCRCIQKLIFPEQKWKIPYRIFDQTISMIYRVHSPSYYVNKEIEILSKYKFENSKYVSCNGAGWCEKGKLLKDIYLDRVQYDFDGIKVWGIREYDGHLTTLYGDYLTPPPEDKRVSNHNYTLFVKREVLEDRTNGKK